MQSQTHIREGGTEAFPWRLQGHREEEDVTSQFRIYLCSYQAMSQGSANSDITGLVQEVGKTHKAGLGQLHTGQLQRRSQAATTTNGDPAFAPVPENVQLSLGLSVHLPANATTVCSSGSEQADALGVWPPLGQYEGLSELQQRELFYFRGRAGLGEREPARH